MNLWRRAIGLLTAIYVSRMLGMFMVFPVFSAYGQSLAGADEATVGLALGAYGLSQGALQIVFGRLSDRFGRRPLIIIGLIIFALGSFWAAAAGHIYEMIGARLLQGMGAVSAVTLAYATDISPREKLPAAMAIIGASIGLAFVFSLMLAPLLQGWLGVDGIFNLIGLLALLAAVAGWFLPPSARREMLTGPLHYNGRGLAQVCLGVFLLHFLFTGAFVVLPPLFNQLALTKKQVLWGIYLSSNLLALACMRRGRQPPQLLNLALDFITLALSFSCFALSYSFPWALIAAVIFFIGFYRLETGLPQLVATLGTADIRGRLMGYFTTSQFVGSFVGASFSGLVWKNFGIVPVLVCLTLMAAGASLLLFKFGRDYVSK